METVLSVKDFGATGDGTTLDTSAIQAGIDACSEVGGELVFPAGRYISGTLYLKSHVTIRLTSRAVLQSSPHAEHIDSPYQCRYHKEHDKSYCFIYGEDLENVRLLGPGTIDGAGRFFHQGPEYIEANGYAVPVGLCLKGCRNVLLSDLRLKDFGSWATTFQLCREIAVRNVRIFNRYSGNNDGLDFDGCSDVRVHGCVIDSDDDSFCLQNSYAEPSENIMVSDCRFHSVCNPIRIGLLSCGDIRNVTVTNCLLRSFFHCSGIAFMNSEGGIMEDMVFSNIVMEDTPRPIWMVLNRMRCGEFSPDPLPAIGRLRHIAFQNIRVNCSPEWEQMLQTGGKGIGRTPLERAFSSILIAGTPEQAIEDVSLSDMHVTFPGLGTEEQAARTEVPEVNDLKFPADPRNFPHALPCYGLYARHVKGLRLRDVSLDVAAGDARPAMFMDHVEDARARDE
ncbi:glycoside hydrolase family 28 protein [Verrucomicrobiota bacterium]